MLIKMFFLASFVLAPVFGAHASGACDEILSKMQQNVVPEDHSYVLNYYGPDEVLKLTVTSIILHGSSPDGGQSYFSFYYDEPKVVPNLEAYISSVSEESFQSCKVVFAPVEGGHPDYKDNETPIIFGLMGDSVTSLSEDFNLELVTDPYSGSSSSGTEE